MDMGVATTEKSSVTVMPKISSVITTTRFEQKQNPIPVKERLGTRKPQRIPKHKTESSRIQEAYRHAVRNGQNDSRSLFHPTRTAAPKPIPPLIPVNKKGPSRKQRQQQQSNQSIANRPSARSLKRPHRWAITQQKADAKLSMHKPMHNQQRQPPPLPVGPPPRMQARPPLPPMDSYQRERQAGLTIDDRFDMMRQHVNVMHGMMYRQHY